MKSYLYRLWLGQFSHQKCLEGLNLLLRQTWCFMRLRMLHSNLLETANGNKFVKAIGLVEFLNALLVLEQKLPSVVHRLDDPLSDDDVENLKLLTFRKEGQPR